LSKDLSLGLYTGALATKNDENHPFRSSCRTEEHPETGRFSTNGLFRRKEPLYYSDIFVIFRQSKAVHCNLSKIAFRQKPESIITVCYCWRYQVSARAARRKTLVFTRVSTSHIRSLCLYISCLNPNYWIFSNLYRVPCPLSQFSSEAAFLMTSFSPSIS